MRPVSRALIVLLPCGRNKWKNNQTIVHADLISIPAVKNVSLDQKTARVNAHVNTRPPTSAFLFFFSCTFISNVVVKFYGTPIVSIHILHEAIYETLYAKRSICNSITNSIINVCTKRFKIIARS